MTIHLEPEYYHTQYTCLGGTMNTKQTAHGALGCARARPPRARLRLRPPSRSRDRCRHRLAYERSPHTMSLGRDELNWVADLKIPVVVCDGTVLVLGGLCTLTRGGQQVYRLAKPALDITLSSGDPCDECWFRGGSGLCGRCCREERREVSA
ncbi:hypothetical protein C8Q72DRAFT_612109 [Fomitopsis betulina]|nr:hypothetical protein C8Q72DRAFT_612109 [Fomitopsis betulina]